MNRVSRIEVPMKKATRMSVNAKNLNTTDFALVILALINAKSSRSGLIDVKTTEGTNRITIIVDNDETDYDYKAWLGTLTESEVFVESENVFCLWDYELDLKEWLIENATDEFGYIDEMRQIEKDDKFSDLVLKLV